MENEATANRQRFYHRVWATTGIVALIVIIIWIIKATFSVLLLVLAGALIALYFRGLSNLIHRKWHLGKKWSLATAITGTLLLLTGFFILAGARIDQQANQLAQTLPSTIERAKQQIQRSSVGRRALQQLSSGNSTKKLTAAARSFFRSTFGVLGDTYVVLFLGIFFTASPGNYVRGMLQLIPSKAKPRASHVVQQVGVTLTKWLKGKLLAMLVVTVLTLTGLLIINVPMAFVLSLIAGLLNFIPNFGPIIAMIPAVLIGLMQSPATAAMVAGLYILVQVLESNVITPQIQKKLVSIPPALIIIAQLLMGVLTGGWGLVLATPLMLIIIVVVKELYISKMTAPN